jgi:hypothetical protein
LARCFGSTHLTFIWWLAERLGRLGNYVDQIADSRTPVVVAVTFAGRLAIDRRADIASMDLAAMERAACLALAVAAAV